MSREEILKLAGVLKEEDSHLHHLDGVRNIIEKQQNTIKHLSEKTDQLRKALAKIKIDLERGLKDKTKLNDAIYNSINLARSLTPYSKIVDDPNAQGGWKLGTHTDPDLTDDEKTL